VKNQQKKAKTPKKEDDSDEKSVDFVTSQAVDFYSQLDKEELPLDE